MKPSSLKLVAAPAVESSPSDPGPRATADASGAVRAIAVDGLSVLALDFIGHYQRRIAADAFLDFETLAFHADGTYEAKVLATLVNPAVRTFGNPCTLPESGTWNAYKVGDRTKIRVRPTTGRARVYEAASLADAMTLERRGASTTLARVDAAPAAAPSFRSA